MKIFDNRLWRGVTMVRCLWALFLLSPLLYGSQFGPKFPTHRFPTDKSWHLSYLLGFATTESNYIPVVGTQALVDSAQLKIMRHQIMGEFQPNRNLSVGARIIFDRMTMNTSGDSVSRSGFGDQSLFAEYRFLDSPGFSLGTSFVAKFPLYSNPVAGEANTDGYALLLGDSQTDYGPMLNAEIWVNRFFRFQLDLGILLRTENLPNELPYMVSVGYVTPKLDLSLRVFGSKSLGGGDEIDGSNVTGRDSVREQYFNNSYYAYSPDPSILVFNPHVELWFNPRWGVQFDYERSLTGSNSPNFYLIQLGVLYRFSEKSRVRRRQFREVDITTEFEKNDFDFEAPEGNSQPPTSFGEEEF